MTKWDALKTYITTKINELGQAPGGTNSITNFAKEIELRLLLQEMNRLDVEFDQDRKFETQVKLENESLSEAAQAEWDRTTDNFYFSDVPDFDRAAWNKILTKTKSKSVK